MTDLAPNFDAGFRGQLLLLLKWRRDVRHFLPTPVDNAVIASLIDAACLAPSVGYSQPWRFVRVASPAARAAIRANFERCNADALADFNGERAKKYATLKLAGLDDAPCHLAVFTDHGAETGHGLGRKTMPETLNYSTVMAIQNLWLAARAMGVGLGWVSILDPAEMCRDLGTPQGWSFTAYLCVGYPAAVSDEPELQRLGWEERSARSRAVVER